MSLAPLDSESISMTKCSSPPKALLWNGVDGVARDVYFYLGKIRLGQPVFSLCHYWPILFPFCQQIPDDPCRFIGQGIASNYSCSLD